MVITLGKFQWMLTGRHTTMRADGDSVDKAAFGGPIVYGHGEENVKSVAYIREDECIGCTKCIQACPVDAILGAAKQMHTVITSECTGCDLCVEPCPVDCIDMIPEQETLQTWHWNLPDPVSREVTIIATDAERAA